MLNEKDILQAKYDLIGGINKAIANAIEVLDEDTSSETLKKLDDKFGYLEFRIENVFDRLLDKLNKE